MSNTPLKDSFGSAVILLSAVGLATAAAPAQARYVEADYSGIVLGFAPGESLLGVLVLGILSHTKSSTTTPPSSITPTAPMPRSLPQAVPSCSVASSPRTSPPIRSRR